MALYIKVLRGATNVIETLEIETYIKGVVAGEVPSTWRAEALKAQAIASRTYACAKITANSNKSYHIADNSNEMAYVPNNISSNVASAVESTAGKVLTYTGSVLDTCVYSASNGGYTVDAGDVWVSSRPYLVAKYDPYDSAANGQAGYSGKNGHGVGMSQWGAEMAARQGLSSSAILNFYYPGTTIVSNYNGLYNSSSSTSTGNVGTPVTEGRPATNIGATIVAIARSKIGTPYSMDTDKRLGPAYFDCSGLCLYCYETAGVPLEGGNTVSIYDSYVNRCQNVSADATKAGDLIFYQNTSQNLASMRPGNPITHMAIANGSGGKIHASSSRGVVEESNLLAYSYLTNAQDNKPFAILRVLSDSETTGVSSPAGFVEDYVSNSDVYSSTNLSGTVGSLYEDRYAEDITANLSRVEAAGYDYGYLIDLANGGEFRFPIPEFSEGVNANWSDISILGRSVSVKSYESTSSRSITVDLDLYAGEGLYKKVSEDIVGDMYKDIYFVKSLEYPDYSDAAILPPPNVQLIMGPHICIEGVITNVNINYLKPMDTQKRSMYVKLSFTIVEIATNPPDLYDIRNTSIGISSNANKEAYNRGGSSSGYKYYNY